MKVRIKLEQISFLKFAGIVLKPFWKWLIGYSVFAVLLYALVSLAVFRYAWAYYHILMVFGLLLSYLIHEYVHIYMIKFFNGGWVNLEFSFLRISIIPEFIIEKKQLLIVTLSGPIACVVVSGIIFSINSIVNHFIVEFLAYTYLLHIINLLPPLGDGNMLVKALIQIYRGKEVNNYD